jgi:hypothetical protein
LQDAAVVHNAGAIEQHVQWWQAGHQALDGGLVQHIQHGGAHVGDAFKSFQQLRVEVGGDHLCAFSGHGQHAGAPDALAGGGDEGGFTL